MNIVLIGLPGTGKSRVAIELALQLGLQYVDTDEIIVKRTGKEIQQIFHEIGEEGFRDLESEVCRELKGLSSAVIATGGGLVLRRENRGILEGLGMVVALTADYDTLLFRLSKSVTRPLLGRGKLEDELLELMRKRLGVYDWADYIIDTSYMTPREVANSIVNLTFRSDKFEED